MSKTAVLVLANLMDKHGSLNLESKLRAERAVEVYKISKASTFVTSGWNYRIDSDICIADAMRDYISKSFGISLGSIIAEYSARDTVGDAFFSKINLAVALNWEKIIVVTSNYHAERTRKIFEFIYGDSFSIEVIPVDVVFSAEQVAGEIESFRAFEKTFEGVEKGDTLQIYNRLLERHPFYNGDVYERI